MLLVESIQDCCRKKSCCWKLEELFLGDQKSCCGEKRIESQVVILNILNLCYFKFKLASLKARCHFDYLNRLRFLPAGLQVEAVKLHTQSKLFLTTYTGARLNCISKQLRSPEKFDGRQFSATEIDDLARFGYGSRIYTQNFPPSANRGLGQEGRSSGF